MLRMELTPLVLGPDQVRALEVSMWEALFDHVERHPRRIVRHGLPSVSVTEAKEILKVALPHYRGGVAPLAAALASGEAVPRRVGQRLHQWIHGSIRYFRRTGARTVRDVLTAPSRDRACRLWNALFDAVLLGEVQGAPELADAAGREEYDLAMEALKLWVADIARRLESVDRTTFSPAVFFLDTEGDLDAVVEIERRRLHVRGRPDALLFDQQAGRIALCEYKFGSQGELELQIAQLLLYVRLLEQAKGVEVAEGELQVFRARPEVPAALADDDLPTAPTRPGSEFPIQVDEAFDGFVGNTAAVRRLKIQCTLALRGEKPVRMSVNLMLCGPPGIGKTELARRVARALALPFIDLPAGRVSSIDELIATIDRTLSAAGIDVPLEGRDTGLPVRRYPPLVLFLDEVHELRRRADALLTVFEPRDRRAVGTDVVGDLSLATMLGATTDRGILPGAFLSRFRAVDLEAYSDDEVATLLEPLFAGHDAPRDLLEAIARIGRLTPRLAIERAREVIDRYAFDPVRYPLTRAGLLEICREQWGVDEHGLTESDRRYLRSLADAPRGLTALAAMLPVGREEIERVIEPFLLQIDAIRITASGRTLTEWGRVLAGCC